MANTKASIQDKQYLAKVLFVSEQLDQKVVAKRVGISEKTMSKWVNEGNWKTLRNRLLMSKEQLINKYYQHLENINNAIDKEERGYGDTKQADIMIKYTAAIRNLETDLGIAELVESGMRFIKFLQKVGTTEQVIEVADLWNAFLNVSLKK